LSALPFALPSRAERAVISTDDTLENRHSVLKTAPDRRISRYRELSLFESPFLDGSFN
jgi:hypothetical protein